MRARARRNDLYGYKRPFGHGCQVDELIVHGPCRADEAVQHCLVEDGDHLRWLGRVEDGLPADAGGDQVIERFRADVGLRRLEQRAGVIRRLEQARHHQRLPYPQRGGLLLGYQPILEPSWYRTIPPQPIFDAESTEPAEHVRKCFIASSRESLRRIALGAFYSGHDRPVAVADGPELRLGHPGLLPLSRPPHFGTEES